MATHANGNGTQNGHSNGLWRPIFSVEAIPNANQRVIILGSNGHSSGSERPANGRSASFFQDFGVWQDAPVLTGSTKFEPLPDVKNIMITGGAGFM